MVTAAFQDQSGDSSHGQLPGSDFAPTLFDELCTLALKMQVKESVLSGAYPGTHPHDLLLFVAAIMSCLLIIQALPCVTMKRKRHREKSDHVRVHFAQPRSTHRISSLAESIWCSAFSHPQTGSGDHLIARPQTSVKGQPTVLAVLSIPCPSLHSVLAMEVSAATEYLFPQTSVQPKEKSLSSLNPQACGPKHTFQLPTACYLSNLNLTSSPGQPRDQRLEPSYSSRERRLSSESRRDNGEYPEKDKVPHGLQSVRESRPNSGSVALLNAHSLSSDLVSSITLSSPEPHQLAQAPGMWVPVAGESQPSHWPPKFWSCLQDKSTKPNPRLKDLPGQNGEAPVATFNPSVTIASPSVNQPKRSTGGYSAGLRSTTGASDQNGRHPKVAGDDGSFTVSHPTNSSHLGCLKVNVSKDHSTEQTPSLISISSHCQGPRPLPAPTSSVSKLQWKSEASFAAPTHMVPSQCDEFVEIPLDETFPPNPKAVPERKAWLAVSEPLSELCTKILPSSIFNCFHIPATGKLRAPVGKSQVTASSNTLSVRVESGAPGSGTGLDAGHLWGKILNVSRSRHEALPWGETFADLLFQEIFKPSEILKSDPPISSRRTELGGQSEFQLSTVERSKTCKDQDGTESVIPVNKELFTSIPGQPNRLEQFIHNSHSEFATP
ncbi:uncharacterized protein [Scyliorhinus torazame]|uniref:uncharacterized protein n=1 Tax=Scyliorhinus torazame TaxID=75743 RepID=UPI003B5C373D